MKPTLDNLVKDLIGCEVKPDHPVTVLNPKPTFIVNDTRIENNKVYVRGVDTCWFSDDLVEVISRPVDSQLKEKLNDIISDVYGAAYYAIADMRHIGCKGNETREEMYEDLQDKFDFHHNNLMRVTGEKI